MLRLICQCLWLLVFCVGCVTAPASAPLTVAPAAAPPSVAKQPGASVDPGCAYFYFLWGKTAEADHRYDDALDAYRKALDCDPQADYLMRDLSIFLVKMGKKDEAVQLLDKLIALHPKDIEVLTLQGNLYAAMGQVEQAAAVYNSILAMKPEDANTMLLLGSLYARDGRYDQARTVLERLVKLDDRSFVGYQYLAKLYRELGAYDKAAASYDKALDLHWLPELALEASDIYEFLKQDDKVITICRRILTDDPDHEKARQRLVRLFLRNGEVDRALDELWELRRHAVNVEEVDYTIGRVLLSNSRFDQAIDHFSDMLEKEPDSANLRYLLALAYAAKGDNQSATDLLGQVQPQDAVYEDAVMVLVEFLVNDKKLAEAETLLTKAISDPQRRRARFYAGLAGIYRQQDRVEEGRKIFAQGFDLYPKDAQLHYEYGLFLDRVGANEEALAAMKQVLKYEPHNAYALNYIGYVWADSGRNLEEARKYIEEAALLRPQDGFIRDSLGWVYFKLGNIDRALAELKRAVGMSADPIILEHLGDVQRAAGKTKEAIRTYEKAVELFEKEEDRARLRDKLKAVRGEAH